MKHVKVIVTRFVESVISVLVGTFACARKSDSRLDTCQNLQSHEEKDRKLLTLQHWDHITPHLFVYCNEIYISKGGFAHQCSSLVQEVEIFFKINKVNIKNTAKHNLEIRCTSEFVLNLSH